MNSPNPNIDALKLLHSFCPSYFPMLVAKAFFDRLSPYFNLYLSAEIVNEIVKMSDEKRLVTLVIITITGNFAIAVISGILNRIFGHCGTLLNQKEVAFYNRKMLTLDYSDLENTEVRQLRRKISESAKIDNRGRKLLLLAVEQMVHVTISTVLALVLGIEMFVLMCAPGFESQFAAYVAAIAVLVVFEVRYSLKIEDKMGEISQLVSQTMIDENRIDEAVDCYNMGKDVRLYRQDKMIMKIKNYAFELHKKAFRMMAEKKYRINIPLDISQVLLRAIIYMFVCIYVQRGIFGVGSIIKYVGFVETITGSITSYFKIFAQIKYNSPFVRDYLAYFNLPNRMQNGTLDVPEINENEYYFEFRDVSFRYPNTEAYALRHINIRFRVGKRFAVVGQNGSGKTTFIKLLCRLYDPTEGEILLNGVDIQNYKYNEYLELFSVVFQDFKLFSFSLGQNVASAVQYDEKKVTDCLNRAGFGKRLAAMPNGLETSLYKDFEKNGIEISGGEAQKIALARALYKEAPFIILDEPTAALDPISEYEIYTKFNDIADDRTVIYISHRLASCRFCDTIMVFDNGNIVQAGTHDELAENEDGKYYQLWNAQAKYYE